MSNDKELGTEGIDETLANAIRYSTIETTSLFDKGNPSFRVVRSGRVIMKVSYVAIWWGATFGAMSLLFSYLILIKLLGLTSYISGPIIFATFILSVFGGGKLGTWSPIKKETGEDLITYLLFKLRKRMSVASYGDAKQSETMLFSKALSSKGDIVSCKRYMGTQPLRNAPPMSPYEDVTLTRISTYPMGEIKVVDSDNYKDGVGER